jgi:hypothetical protein
MHPRPGSSAPPTGQSCPIDRAALHKADTVRGPPAWSLSAGLSTCARSRGHTRPLSGTHPPAQRDTPAHSTGHTRPLDGTHPPTRRDTPAHSTGHTCPLDGTHLPARRDTPAHSAGHTCPLGGTLPPAGRDTPAHSAGHIYPLDGCQVAIGGVEGTRRRNPLARTIGRPTARRTAASLPMTRTCSLARVTAV